MLTYDDPRVVHACKASNALETHVGVGSLVRGVHLPANEPPLSRGRRMSFKSLLARPNQTSAAAVAFRIGPNVVASYELLDDNLTKKSELPCEARTKVMNRHLDVLPNPRTRVVLPRMGKDAATEYINANFVRGPDGTNQKHYIVC